MTAQKKARGHFIQFATRAIHVGQEPESATGAITVPIYQTSTFAQIEPGIHKGYDYSRTDNPTRTALQTALASLETAEYCLAFSSGMGAASTVMLLFKKGDHVVSSRDVYGGTYRLFRSVLQDFGLTFSFVETSSVREIERAITRRTRLVWIESPTNPLLRITDISAAAKIAHDHRALCLVDNTFASPFFQRPLELGADLVLHSTTKYLAGHADVVGGAICLNEPSLYERLKFLQNAAGATPSPFDCFLTLRGMKTLALRMREHEKNAMQIAQFLQDHPRVRRVYYPGLPNHPGHDLAASQMDGFSGIVSFEVKGGLADARRVLGRLRLFKIAESLGGVESLVELPAIMTHASIPKKERKRAGLYDGLIRLSVGIEHVQDLLADLKRALLL
ncbi:MAG TPA: cystathionine gamma-synthase [Candidatus Binatia bacterium]|nr:cystathionine gamma-synthase [Candidatus Binatia bacterium]HEV8722235.1 cystathionine gamma-synthase [Candidatus Binatia bacterium]